MLANCASAALVAIVTGVSARRSTRSTVDSAANQGSNSLSVSAAASSATRWHATLTGLAAAGLLSFGIRALHRREGRVGEPETTPHSRLTSHVLLNSAAVAQTLAGVGLAWVAARSKAHQRHVTTWHGLIGSVASLALIVQFLASLLLRFWYRLQKKKASKLRLALEFLHAVGGGATFSLMSAAVCSGFFTDWFLQRCQPAWLLAAIICLHLIGLRVLAQIWEHYFKK